MTPTQQDWDRYYEDLAAHEERVKREEPDIENYPTEKAYLAAVSEWEIMRSCDAPNKPGYFRANND